MKKCMICGKLFPDERPNRICADCEKRYEEETAEQICERLVREGKLRRTSAEEKNDETEV